MSGFDGEDLLGQGAKQRCDGLSRERARVLNRTSEVLCQALCSLGELVLFDEVTLVQREDHGPPRPRSLKTHRVLAHGLNPVRTSHDDAAAFCLVDRTIAPADPPI